MAKAINDGLTPQERYDRKTARSETGKEIIRDWLDKNAGGKERK